jgi:hypothetical protein
MNDLERWLAANDQYLATALEWLHGRLERLAGEDKTVLLPAKDLAQPPKPAPVSMKQRSLLERLFKSETTRLETVPALPFVGEEAETPGSSGNESVPMPAATTDVERPPALMLLALRLGLTEFERQTLFLCAAMELDTRTGNLCARAQQDPARPYPTFALALALFDQPAWDVLSPERPLRYWRLIEINQPGAQPLINSALKADERVVNYIKGLNYLDDRLAPLMLPAGRDDAPLPPSQSSVADTILHHVERLQGRTRLLVFQLLGHDSPSKLMIARQALARLDLALYRMPADALPTQTGDHETFVRLWQRESALLPIALYVEAQHVEHAGNAQASTLQRLCSRGTGVMFLDTREPWADLGRDSISIDIAKPTPAEQHRAWAEALGEASGDHPSRLAGQFNFNSAAIRGIASGACASAANDREKLGVMLWAECLRYSRPALDQLAQLLDPKATWEELELPAIEKSLLRQIAEQVKSRMAVYDRWGFRERMNRGLGISALFAGESGTGKTMAAEVIANELKLLLYRIDLSAVVSKYIGETEKNLRRLFDAAEDGGAILFFDEADALFGKRSEVKDSHDRYANIEINYLLQRMEAYRGLAILATNMKASLDSAFLRRLRFIVNFPFPSSTERMAIWRKVFPSQTPVADIDYQRLTRLNLTGGSIHNIALNAAFLAVQAGTAVTMPLILDAARTEFRKLEKPINEADFRSLESARSSA